MQENSRKKIRKTFYVFVCVFFLFRLPPVGSAAFLLRTPRAYMKIKQIEREKYKNSRERMEWRKKLVQKYLIKNYY